MWGGDWKELVVSPEFEAAPDGVTWNKCNRVGDLANMGSSRDQRTANFLHNLLISCISLTSRCCWMTEITNVSQAVLDAVSSLDMTLQCHVAESNWELKDPPGCYNRQGQQGMCCSSTKCWYTRCLSPM